MSLGKLGLRKFLDLVDTLWIRIIRLLVLLQPISAPCHPRMRFGLFHSKGRRDGTTAVVTIVSIQPVLIFPATTANPSTA